MIEKRCGKTIEYRIQLKKESCRKTVEIGRRGCEDEATLV